MRLKLLPILFILCSSFTLANAQCADLFEVSGENFTRFCGVTGTGGQPITVTALGADSLTLMNVMGFGDTYTAKLYCASDSFYIHRQQSNGHEIEARCWRQAGFVNMSITEYDTATGQSFQSCSGNYTAPPVSIEDAMTDPLVNVSPNPFGQSTRFTLSDEVSDPQNWNLAIYDLRGAVVKSFEGLSREVVFDRGNLSEGLYFYRLSDSEGVRDSGKLLIH